MLFNEGNYELNCLKLIMHKHMHIFRLGDVQIGKYSLLVKNIQDF